jgi:putative membrane protein
MDEGGIIMMGYGYGIMALGLILGLGTLAVIVCGLALLFRFFRQPRQHFMGGPAQNALEILNSRYAKGEISDEEYRAKKAELMK